MNNCLRALASLFLAYNCSCSSSSTNTNTNTTPPTNNLVHPRIWMTAADLPRLRSWATDANPIYAQALKPSIDRAIADYNTLFFPGGVEANPWPDPGDDQGYTPPVTEVYAEFFAFLSIIVPDEHERAQHAARARNLLMHAITEAAKGVDDNKPFQAKNFFIYNRGSGSGEAFGATVDWLQASPGALSAADKALIQKVFLRWANDCINAETTGGDHPEPKGVVNDASLVTADNARMAANNYYSGHMRNLTLIALSLDEADDPPDASGKTLRSYISNVTGAWLYRQYAVYEDAEVVTKALGIPMNKNLGVAAGGLAPEGFMYGESLGMVLQALLALQTAGYGSVDKSGPQINFIKSNYWDLFVTGFLESIEPAPQMLPGWEYLGPVYQVANYGDVHQDYVVPDYINAFGPLAILDGLIGHGDRAQKDVWILTNVIQGGADSLMDRAGRDTVHDLPTLSAIFHFLAFDPGKSLSSVTAPAGDPRPALPTTFYAPRMGRVLARTDWTPDATWFVSHCSWLSINHQLGQCNGFELYRKGEWLTKFRDGYDNGGQGLGLDPQYSSTLAIENPSGQPEWFEQTISDRGGQWVLGGNAGDPVTLASLHDSWIFTQGDATNLYNRPDSYHPKAAATDVQHASRSLVWLKPDRVVVYDRATSKSDNRYKRFNLVLVPRTDSNGHAAPPAITGNTVQEITPKGQQLFVTSLLPSAASLSVHVVEPFNPVAWGEATQDADGMGESGYVLQIEDKTEPRDVRFLTVLQGADGNASQDALVAVASDAGSSAAFDGVLIQSTAGNTVVLFARNLGGDNSSVKLSYTLPSGIAASAVSHTLVTGLAPSAPYAMSASGGAVTITGGAGSLQSNAEGILEF